MAKTYQEVEVFCAVAQIKIKIQTLGGKTENGMNGRVQKPCPGCAVWNEEKIASADASVAFETHEEVASNREFQLTQTLSYQNLDETAPIVINMCSPVG